MTDKTMYNIDKEIRDSIAVKQALLADDALMAKIAAAADMLTESLRSGHMAFLAGNGGSAADSQHLAGELVNKLYFDRPGIPAHALTTDTSIMTAIGNDMGYQYVFSRQLEAQAREGDVFIAISTSGSSVNIIEALPVCRQKGIRTIGLTGLGPTKMDALCDICINVPSKETPRIQESHILIGHILCGIVEKNLFGR